MRVLRARRCRRRRWCAPFRSVPPAEGDVRRRPATSRGCEPHDKPIDATDEEESDYAAEGLAAPFGRGIVHGHAPFHGTTPAQPYLAVSPLDPLGQSWIP